MKRVLPFLFLLGLAAGSVRGVGFMVSPPRCELTMLPGQSQTEVITIVNQETSQPLRLKATVKAWDKDDKGKISYYEPQEKPASCGNWLVVNPSEFELPAGGNERPRFTVTVPESTRGSYWAMIFFENQPDTTQKADVGIRMVGRVGVAVYVNIAGTLNYQSQLTSLTYRRAGYQNHEFTVGVKNEGNAYFRPKGSIEIKDQHGKKIAASNIPDDLVVLPGADGKIKLTVKQVIPPGRYTAIVDLDTGLPELLQGEVGFEVVQ